MFGAPLATLRCIDPDTNISKDGDDMMEARLLQELEHVFNDLTPADYLALEMKSRIGQATDDESARYMGIVGKIEALKIINMLDVLNCEVPMR